MAWWVGISLSVFCAVGGADEPDVSLEFRLSRVAPVAQMVADHRTTVVLRLDRDIQRARLELRAAGETPHAGSWKAVLVELPPVEEPPGRGEAEHRPVRTVWSRQGRVLRGSPATTALGLSLGRKTYASYRLDLTPEGIASTPVWLVVTALPVEEQSRRGWILRQRAGINPDTQRDRLRNLVRFMTDAEVRYWTSWRDRQTFLLVWRAMKEVDRARNFPGVEGGELGYQPHFIPIGPNERGIAQGASFNSTDTFGRSSPSVQGFDLESENVPVDPLPRGATVSLGSATGAPRAGRVAPPYPQFLLGRFSPSQTIRLRVAAGRDATALLRFGAEVRTLNLTMLLPRDVSPGNVAITGTDWPPARDADGKEAPRIRTTLFGAPDWQVRGQTRLWPGPPRGYRLNMPHGEVCWLLRLRGLALSPGTPAPEMVVDVTVTTDSRPLTDRERELMAWRARVDPATQVEEVREMVGRLTDEEVLYYTHFKDRETFLKYWGRLRSSDMVPLPNGRRRLPPDAGPLSQRGKPLPDGNYLHHNGTPRRIWD